MNYLASVSAATPMISLLQKASMVLNTTKPDGKARVLPGLQLRQKTCRLKARERQRLEVTPGNMLKTMFMPCASRSNSWMLRMFAMS